MTTPEQEFQRKVYLFCALLGIFGSILGALIGGVSSYYGAYDLNQRQLNLEKDAVAQAIYIDVYATSEILNVSLNHYNSGNNLSSNDRNVFYDVNPYYRTNGIYFAYLPEIYKLDANTSADIYAYYIDILYLEHERQYIVDHYTNKTNYKNLQQTELTYLGTYTILMPDQISAALVQGDKVKNELNEKYNINFDSSTLKITSANVNITNNGTQAKIE